MNRNSSKQLFLNIFASIAAFVINTGIQFVVTPILTKNVGDEAFGFITIANDFTNYAGIFAVVLNSVSARFISVEIHGGNIKKAEEYYSSVFVGNIAISVILALLGAFVVMRFDTFLVVSPELVPDIAALFAITFGNYIISVLISLFTVSIFVKNRIDLSSIRNIISYIIKLVVVVVLFSLAGGVKVYYLAIATLVSTIFLGVANARISRRIMPEIRVRSDCFRPKLILELLHTGIWMSVNNLSNVISNSFTTIIINLSVGPVAAGFFSVARTIPNAANSFIFAIYSVFVPTFYELYAKDKREELVQYGILSMKTMTFITTIPVLVLCIESRAFLSLWQPYRSHDEVVEMSIIFVLILALCVLYTSVLSISQLGLVANKVGWQTLNNIFISCATLVGTIASLSLTNWGLIGIACVILTVQGSKWVVFTPIYAAYAIGAPKLVFFKENVKIIICEAVVLGVLVFASSMLNCTNWLSLVLSSVGLCLLGYAILFIIMLSKTEKEAVLKIAKHVIIRTGVEN